jgi:hypothetical protein
MPGGMLLIHGSIVLPKIRNSMVFLRRCEASDSAYGPAPIIATSIIRKRSSRRLAPIDSEKARAAPDYKSEATITGNAQLIV